MACSLKRIFGCSDRPKISWFRSFWRISGHWQGKHQRSLKAWEKDDGFEYPREAAICVTGLADCLSMVLDLLRMTCWLCCISIELSSEQLRQSEFCLPLVKRYSALIALQLQ